MEMEVTKSVKQESRHFSDGRFKDIIHRHRFVIVVVIEMVRNQKILEIGYVLIVIQN